MNIIGSRIKLSQLNRLNHERENELYESIKHLSPERRLEIAKDYFKERDYFSAGVVLRDNGALTSENVAEISKIYSDLAWELMPRQSTIIKGIDPSPKCMENSVQMHSEGKLSKEDLSLIEKLVDEVRVKTLGIKYQEKDEVEKLYCLFKEYCLNVFLGEK